MILLSVVCVMLYVLGAVLAYELAADLDHPAKRIVVVLCWPSVAVFLLFSTESG